MPHDSDSFWLSVFRKSPIIGTFMAIGTALGLGAGLFFFLDPRLVSVRVILCLIASCTFGGMFVGLVIGVIIDSAIGAMRSDRPRKRRNDRPIKRIYDGD
jgi:hypothetical protein